MRHKGHSQVMASTTRTRPLTSGASGARKASDRFHRPPLRRVPPVRPRPHRDQQRQRGQPEPEQRGAGAAGDGEQPGRAGRADLQRDARTEDEGDRGTAAGGGAHSATLAAPAPPVERLARDHTSPTGAEAGVRAG